MKGRHALLDHIFELTDRCFFEIDMVQDERTLRAECEGFNDADGEGSVGFWKG